MKFKITLLAAFIISSTAYSNAQSTIFMQGDRIVNFGLGIGSYFKNSDYRTSVPTLSLSYEYGVKDYLFDANSSLGVGGILGYYGEKINFQNAAYNQPFGYKNNSIILGARLNVHYQFVDYLDTYVGGMLGYNIGFSTTYGDGPIKNYSKEKIGGVFYGFYIGGRYYFLEKLAGFAEIGYGISAINIGLAMKL